MYKLRASYNSVASVCHTVLRTSGPQTEPLLTRWILETSGGGAKVGKVVGAKVGETVGDAVGAMVGDAVGAMEGLVVGEAEGDAEGLVVGALVGSRVLPSSVPAAQV